MKLLAEKYSLYCQISCLSKGLKIWTLELQTLSVFKLSETKALMVFLKEFSLKKFILKEKEQKAKTRENFSQHTHS